MKFAGDTARIKVIAVEDCFVKTQLCFFDLRIEGNNIKYPADFLG